MGAGGAMKKYIFVFKATLIESLQYIMNILLGFITFFMILFVMANLWEYIYNDSANLINGYSKTQMIWYVILTEIMWYGTKNRTLIYQISDDIKSGTIAYGINKPYHYILYIIAKHMGDITIKLLLFLSAGFFIGHIFIGRIPNFNVNNLPLILLSFFFAVMINSFIRMGISILSFWIEDSGPFHWIYDKLIIVIGTMFPVEMFPVWAQSIIKVTPIYVVTYGPAKLMIDFSREMALRVIFIQAIYFLVTLLLLFVLFQRGVKKLNVNGG
jgi:ABC-2 type transport system permease protein